MGRKNSRATARRSFAKGKGKGQGARKRTHRSVTGDILPDMGTGADPTQAAPVPLHGKIRANRRHLPGGAA